MASRNLVRVASRSVLATAPTVPSSYSSRCLSLSSAGGRPLHATSPPPPASIVSAAAGWEPRTLRCDGGEEDWEEVVAPAGDARGPDGRQEATDVLDSAVFGMPPTDDEVRAAVASINQVFENPSTGHYDYEAADLRALALPILGHRSGLFINHFALDTEASSEVGLDEWTEPAMLVLNSSALLTKEHRSVLDAFRLLQKDTSVQKMVMALSTDKAVWNAVMNNEVVQEFKRSFQDAKETVLKENSTSPPGFMMWVLKNTKTKIRDFLEKILGLVNMLFQAGGKDYDLSDDAVKMSFMLSVFIFIVVTIARMH